MTRELFLHAGAHRTGTSSFQLALAENRAALEAAGYDLAYPGRDGAPQGKLRLKLPDDKMGPDKRAGVTARAEREIAKHMSKGRSGLILSEENIPGRMFHFYRGRFFPGAEARFSGLRAALMAAGIARPKRLVYVVRDYASLFVSGFRKRAEDNAVGRFSDLAEGMVTVDRGWPELLQGMAEALEPEVFHVVEYGARGSSTALLQRLIEDAPEGLVEPKTTVNLSATDAALEDLQARYHAGETLERAQWQDVIAAHAGDREPRGFAAFSQAQKAKLDARYAADLERIAAMDGITFTAG